MKSKKEKLIELRKKMQDDDTLPLKAGATSLVFGAGNPNAEVMFIGEGPGYHEDQKAIPFVGRAGVLLNEMLLSIKLPREHVFITNVVHHRPPNNRDPLPEELEAYAKYLDPMIKIIGPKIIVTLGRFSMAKFIPGVFISNVHGQTRNVQWEGKNLAVIPMYHPAAALRNGAIKAKAIEDFKKIKVVLDGKLEDKEEKKKDSAPEPKQRTLA